MAVEVDAVTTIEKSSVSAVSGSGFGSFRTLRYWYSDCAVKPLALAKSASVSPDSSASFRMAAQCLCFSVMGCLILSVLFARQLRIIP